MMERNPLSDSTIDTPMPFAPLTDFKITGYFPMSCTISGTYSAERTTYVFGIGIFFVLMIWRERILFFAVAIAPNEFMVSTPVSSNCLMILACTSALVQENDAFTIRTGICSFLLFTSISAVLVKRILHSSVLMRTS